MTSSSLYRALADELRAAIMCGRYQIASRLPTELELCDTHDVSRHTAREALRVLLEEGLIARRRGVGTIVIANGLQRPFTQKVGDVGDLLQYAREARLEIRMTGPSPLHDSDGRVLGLDLSLPWVRIDGLRRAVPGAPPLALTRIFVREHLCPASEDIESWPGALNELIEKQSGVSPQRITQEIVAVALSRIDARYLEAEQGAPALRTLRRYFDKSGAVFQASLSLHPGDRFVYAMAISRES